MSCTVTRMLNATSSTHVGTHKKRCRQNIKASDVVVGVVVVVVVLTLTRIIKSMVTGQAPVTLELRNTPGNKNKQTSDDACYNRGAPTIVVFLKFLSLGA